MHCPDGGTGRRGGLRSHYFGVRVRVSLGAPIKDNEVIKPLHNKIVIEEVVHENTSASGIVLAGNANADIKRSCVLAIGDKVEDVKVGDTLIVDWQFASKSSYNNKTIFIIKETDVIAVIQPD
jgi:chaperonin GroES